jgi:hypothetical protein
MNQSVEIFRQCSNHVSTFIATLNAFSAMHRQRQALFESILSYRSVGNACASASIHAPTTLRLCVEPLGVLGSMFAGSRVTSLLLAQYDADLTSLLVALNTTKTSIADLLQRLRQTSDCSSLKYSGYSVADCREAVASMVRCVTSIHTLLAQIVSALRCETTSCTWDGEAGPSQLRLLLDVSGLEPLSALVATVGDHAQGRWTALVETLDPVAACILLQ